MGQAVSPAKCQNRHAAFVLGRDADADQERVGDPADHDDRQQLARTNIFGSSVAVGANCPISVTCD